MNAGVRTMPRSPVKSAARALEVLELFAEMRTPLRLNYLAKRLAYPQSSTTVLLKSLLTLGYLNYDRLSRTYFPTTRVAAIGDWVRGSMFGGGGELLELTRAIHARTGETVTLVAQNDIYVQYLDVVPAAHASGYEVREGSMRLLTHSGAGLMLLSQMKDPAVEKLLRHINLQDQDITVRMGQAELMEQVAAARHQGYCYLCGVPEAEVATLAVLLPLRSHGIPLAMEIGGQNQRITRNRMAHLGAMRDVIDSFARTAA